MNVPAPELVGHGGWIGVEGNLSLAALRGKVVLLNFWSLACAKCLRVLGELRRVQARFPDEVVVVSVHSPKFPYTGDHQALRRAVARHHVDHPVLDDPDMVTWQQYGIRGWPTVVVVSPRGEVVGAVPGDGQAALLYRVVADVVDEHRTATRLQHHRLPVVPPRRDPSRRPGSLWFPGKVAGDRGGRLAIADTGNDRVVLVAFTGRDTARITHVVTGLHDPQGVRLYGSDLIVCDTGNDRVVRIDLARRPGPDEAVAPDPAGIVRLAVRPDEVIADGLAAPWDVVADADRSLVVAEAAGQQLWRLPADGSSPAVIAGDRYEGLVDGPAGDAELAQPSGLTRLPNGIAFVDAESSALRLLLDRGRVGTLAGIGLFDWGLRDGRTTAARLQHPEGVVAALDGTSLYVADTYNHRLRWWRDGRLETLAVEGLLEPSGLDTLPDGRLVVADRGNHRICLVDPGTGELQVLHLDSVDLPTEEPRAQWGAPVRAVAGQALAVAFTVDTGPLELDTSVEVPVRVAVTSDPPWLLDTHPPAWRHDAVEGAVPLTAGPAGSGVLTVEVEAATAAEGVTAARRSLTRHRLIVEA